ncbi:peptide-methionine (S)-S-oxide reductase MsrA [Croceivirga sp. JEA036]|uniref:peptide-methionine (S)-S-oxide reductase MsrA n=1 Tax=Croceivirga sp. JEA036 TaxID=2721162 RepID=UPI00143B93A4|nr:peptide-methionine (S)-S-oxide reductase MsrA [Croceivirga sp. JEA036]NJB37573.1 peptide-methionine (S)-S-oxide reductase MsrA [Croceivirga sp. JEA036]
MKHLSILLLALVSISCNGTPNQTKTDTENATKNDIKLEEKVVEQQDLSQFKTAYFASGCFWCVEAIYESVTGVKEVVSGYAGGEEQNPSYKEVSYGRTKHAEAVKVYYDPEQVSFFALVQIFFGSHDPTTLNRQGPDKGPQYRSIAFYKNEEEKKIIMDYMNLLVSEKVYAPNEIVTQVEPFKKFWEAEEYHQDFEKRNPEHPYIKSVSIPRLNRFKENFTDYLKEEAKLH